MNQKKHAKIMGAARLEEPSCLSPTAPKMVLASLGRTCTFRNGHCQLARHSMQRADVHLIAEMHVGHLPSTGSVKAENNGNDHKLTHA